MRLSLNRTGKDRARLSKNRKDGAGSALKEPYPRESSATYRNNALVAVELAARPVHLGRGELWRRDHVVLAILDLA